MRSTANILLKITGELFLDPETHALKPDHIIHLAEQIKQLPSIRFGIVVGGGNFFRGSKQGKDLGLVPSNAHYIGMLATIMNGVILKNIFDAQGLSSIVLSALHCPEIAPYISQDAIDQALEHKKIIIFTGGTGNPFFSTDTNAILRGLQINAEAVWKGTKVDGVYDRDPIQYPEAQKFTQLSFDEAIQRKLKIMDLAAFSLAQEHRLPIRVFNIFEPNALTKLAHDATRGSLIF